MCLPSGGFFTTTGRIPLPWGEKEPFCSTDSPYSFCPKWDLAYSLCCFKFCFLPEENNLGENRQHFAACKKKKNHVSCKKKTIFKLVLGKYFKIVKSKTKKKCTVLLHRVISPATCFQNLKWNVLHRCELHFTSNLPRVSATDTKKCCLQICVADLASWFLITVFTYITGLLLTERKPSVLAQGEMRVSDPLGMVSRARSHSLHFDCGVEMLGPPFCSSVVTCFQSRSL